MADDLDREAQDYFGAPVPAPPAGDVDLDAEANRYFTDTSALDADSDATQAYSLAHDNPIDGSEATRRAAILAPLYYAMPRFLRAWYTIPPDTRDKITTLKRRAANVIERTGGQLAYWASRPQQATTWRGLEELHKRYPGGAEAFERLWRTMPEPGGEHERDVPSMYIHEQLDDVAADTMETTNWLDVEPQIMEKMRSDVDAEKLYVVAKHGGDWDSYQRELQSMPIGRRLARRARFLVEDVLAPDPLFLIGAPIAAVKAVGRGVKVLDQALAARKIGTPLSELRGAVETVEAVHGPIGDLVKHASRLESKLAGATDADEAAKLERRLVEARAELAAREADSAEPIMRLYQPVRRDPESIYRPLRDMTTEEQATRFRAAEGHATIPEAEEAVRGVGYTSVETLADSMEALDPAALRAYEQLPDAVKAYLEELGISRSNVLRADALRRPKPTVTVAQVADLADPDVAASRAFMGSDDVEEAGDGLAHMRDGGDPADISLHAVQAPEYSTIQRVEADGVFLRDVPDYRDVAEGSKLRRMSRRDALTYLLGRYSMPGLGVGSTHVDAPALVEAIHKVGRKTGFAAARFLPLSAATFVPDVARVYDRAAMNYKLLVNEGQDFMRDAMRASGLFKVTRTGTVKVAHGMQGQVDRVIDALNTAPGPARDALLKSMPDRLIGLHNSLRSWFDVQAARLGLDRGLAIEGYFPHYFPEAERATNVRQLEYLGLNPRAYVSFFALKHRTGAQGWSRDMVDVLDLYNRGAARKVVMEPAYQRMLEMADAYRGAGKLDEANYAEKLLIDARGQGRSIFDFFADHMNMPQGARDRIEMVTREATALFYKALLGGNLNYALQNMAGGTTNMAAQSGAFATLQGLLRLATKEGRRTAEESGVLKEALHSLEAMPQNASRALEDAYKVMDVGQKTEHLLRGVAVNTALSELVNRSGRTWKEIRAAGLDQAFIAEAARATDRSQHTFGPMGRSPYLHTLLGHTGYQATIQLGTYPWKQSEYLLRNMAGDPGFIVRYLTYSGIFARMAAETLGVAAGPSVGFGYAQSVINPRKGRILQYSPGVELLASTVDLWEAWRSGDPSEAALAREKLWTAAEAGIPFINQFERYARNLREALAGRTEKFQEREPLGEVTRQLVAGQPEITQVERVLEPDERILHALGVQTVQDRIEIGQRREEKQARQARESRTLARANRREEARRRAADARRQRNAELRGIEVSLEAYDEALRRGDAATASAIYRRGVEEGRMLFSDDQAQAGREAAFLRARIRMLRHAPGFMPRPLGGQ